MTDHDDGGRPDGGARSPSTATGTTTLGVRRVRPDGARRPSSTGTRSDGSRPREGGPDRCEDLLRGEDPARAEDLPRGESRDPVGFEPRRDRDAAHERWKAMAFVCAVLVTLALVAETGVQIAAGIDVLALGPREVAPLRRIDTALATTARRARYVAVVTGGFAVVGVAAATLVAAARTHT